MKAWIAVLVSVSVAGCGNSKEDGGDTSANVTAATFVDDDTFVGVLCPAIEQLCDCNADRTSCPGNEAAVELYSCLWYSADFGDDGMRSPLGDGLRKLETTDEHLCRTLHMPGQECSAKMTTAFGKPEEPYRTNIWEYLDPKPTDPDALIDACADVPP